jgi:integrase
VLSVAEIYRLAESIAPRYRALVLLATFGNMRWGELAGLRCRNLDLDGQVVHVVETVYEFSQLVKGTPKSKASVRKIPLPGLIIAELRSHMERYSPPGPDAFVFVGVKGGQLRRSNFSSTWATALAKAGLPVGIHFHDLRHTGNTFAAETGASLAELMNRMGHASTRAAQVYLHARDERGRQIAETLDKMARGAEPGAATTGRGRDNRRSNGHAAGTAASRSPFMTAPERPPIDALSWALDSWSG